MRMWSYGVKASCLLLVLLVASVSIVKGWENPNLKYFGFYTYNNSDALRMPYANLYESSSLEELVMARTRGLLGFWYVQDIFYTNSFQLRDDYLESWQNATIEVTPLLKNGTVLGFFMGDELINNGVSWDNLDLAVSLVRKTFPESIIYTNEAYVTFAGVNEYYPHVPYDLDWVSIDFYPVWGTFETLRNIYYDSIYPKMAPNQRVMYVSGVYSTVVNPSFYCGGNPHCEQVMISWNLQAFQWATTDPHFVGLFPWHFDTFNTTFLPGFEIGLDQLPQLTQLITSIGTQISTGKPTPPSPPRTGSICGSTAGTSTSITLCNGLNPGNACPSGYVQTTWEIGTTGNGTWSYCSSTSSQMLPTGGICGINVGGDVIPCGGLDPQISCPQGYLQQVWDVAWGTNRMFFCEKVNATLVDLTGTICGMAASGSSVGVACNGISPSDGCPTGYASASWAVPFGSGTWYACFRIV